MFKMFINTLNKKIPFCITLSNHKQACEYDSFCISNYFIFETQTFFKSIYNFFKLFCHQL